MSRKWACWRQLQLLPSRPVRCHRLATAAAAAPASASSLFDIDESPLLRLVDLPGRGRGLVASRRIEPGQVVLSEAPLVSVRLAGGDCKGGAGAVLPASNVKGALRKWQTLDAQLAESDGPLENVVRLSLRGLELLHEDPALWPEVRHLCTPPAGWLGSSIPNQALRFSIVWAALIRRHPSCEALDQQVAEQQWLHLVGAAERNSFRLGHALWPEDQHAVCLFLRASFFNHACQPNIEVLSWRRPVRLRLIVTRHTSTAVPTRS